MKRTLTRNHMQFEETCQVPIRDKAIDAVFVLRRVRNGLLVVNALSMIIIFDPLINWVRDAQQS